MNKNIYTPSKKILERYADLMVNYAANMEKGIKKGDTVYVVGEEAGKPLYVELIKAVWKAGGNVIGHYIPDNESWFNFDKEFFNIASDEQIKFFPGKMLKGRLDESDHMIAYVADTDPKAAQGIDPKKLMMKSKAFKPYSDWKYKKEYKGKFTWTVCLYGTVAMAKEAGISEKEYWNQIIKACYLDKPNPIKEWKRIQSAIKKYKDKLDKLKIEKVHVEGPDVDLWVGIGEKRAWKAGGGTNMPSFEIFTSPDWRKTNGWFKSNQSLYVYGNIIEGIELEFKDGIIVRAKATKNEKVLKEMIATDGANRLGEFSLTDRRFSRITKFMAETLYDENVGGRYGNTHVAIGNAYKDCFAGDPGKVKASEWKRLGYNESVVHTDIVSTAPRTVTAYLPNGKMKVIYKNGQFTL